MKLCEIRRWPSNSNCPERTGGSPSGVERKFGAQGKQWPIARIFGAQSPFLIHLAPLWRPLAIDFPLPPRYATGFTVLDSRVQLVARDTGMELATDVCVMEARASRCEPRAPDRFCSF